MLDPSDLALRTELDGQVKQDSRTSLLLHDVATLVSYVSHVMTLLPGDVILTGTPSGVGPMTAGQTVSRDHRGHRHAEQPGAGAMTVRAPLRPVADRRPARRQRPQRAVQLGVRPARRRRVRAADRGHRRRPQHRGVLPRRGRAAALARPRLGRGTRGRRAVRAVPAVASGRRSTATPSPGCARPATPTTRTPPTRRSRPAGPPRGDKTQGYDNYDRELTDAQVGAFRAEGRTPVVRFRMPDEPVVFDDLVRGEVRFEPENVPDYVLARADGSPLYPLTNPVDDALMGITHVLRGDDLLPSTPRQIPLHAALRSLGIASGPMPRFGHLPMVLGEGGKRLSKRKTPRGVADHHARPRGSCPRGSSTTSRCSAGRWAATGSCSRSTRWSPRSTSTKINRNPATFDVKKLHGDQRGEDPRADAGRVRHAAAAVPGPARAARPRRSATRSWSWWPRPRRWCRSGSATLVEAATLLEFLLVPDDHFERRPGRGGQGADAVGRGRCSTRP